MDEISRLKKVGLALGSSTYGTVSSSFTRGLLVKDFSCSPAQDIKAIPELRGTLDTVRVTKGPITYSAKTSFALDVADATSAGIGDFLGSIYGTDTGTLVAGSPNLYKHKFSLAQTGNPSWLNIWTDKDATSKQYTGFMPASLKVNFSAKEATISCEADGILQTESTLASDQSLIFSDEPLLTPQGITVLKLGGSSVTTFESIDINLKREQEPIQFLGSSRVIGELVSGKAFSIELSLNGLKFANETERAKFLAVGATSFELKVLDANSNYLHFVFPEIYYTTFEGPELNDTDVLRISMAAIVTGDSDNHYIELQNTYSKGYDDGIVIV